MNEGHDKRTTHPSCEKDAICHELTRNILKSVKHTKENCDNILICKKRRYRFSSW